MSRYDDLILLLKNNSLIDDFEKVSKEAINEEIIKYPNLPNDYIDFLKEVGYGDIEMDGYLAIFNGLINPKLIHKSFWNDELNNVLYFGDDLNGFYCGFLLSDNWKVVEVYDSLEIHNLNMNFEDYIRKRVSEYLFQDKNTK